MRAIKRMMRAAETETFDQNVHHVFLQLLPLLGDPQARHLKGATGDMARQPWSVRWSAEQGEVDDEFIRWMSRGVLTPESPAS